MYLVAFKCFCMHVIRFYFVLEVSPHCVNCTKMAVKLLRSLFTYMKVRMTVIILKTIYIKVRFFELGIPN